MLLGDWKQEQRSLIRLRRRSQEWLGDKAVILRGFIFLSRHGRPQGSCGPGAADRRQDHVDHLVLDSMASGLLERMTRRVTPAALEGSGKPTASGSVFDLNVANDVPCRVLKPYGAACSEVSHGARPL